MLDVEAFRSQLGQLWAEARALYLSGGLRYWELSAEVQEKTQVEYQGEDPLVSQAEAFLANLVPYPGAVRLDGSPECRFRMLDLMAYLGMENAIQHRGTTGPLKDILISLGCEHHAKLRIGKTTASGYSFVNNNSVEGY